MLASLIAIGIIGLFFERVVFQTLETVTVARWGVVAAARKVSERGRTSMRMERPG